MLVFYRNFRYNTIELSDIVYNKFDSTPNSTYG